MQTIDKLAQCCGICYSFETRIKKSTGENELFSYCQEHEKVATALLSAYQSAIQGNEDWDLTSAFLSMKLK